MSGVLTGTESKIGDGGGAPRFVAGDSGTAFVFGFSKRGATDQATLLTSLSGYVRECGEAVPYGLVHDVLDVNFRLGLARAYFVRLVGDAAKAASGKVKDGAGEGAKDTLRIEASSAGEWGDDVDWKVTAGTAPGTFRLQASYEGDVEISPDLASNAEAVAYVAANFRYIRVIDLAGGNPVVSEGSLAGGDDDRESVDAETISAARALIPADLGPGQIAAPGFTTEAVHKALIEVGVETKRTPILDGEDTDDAQSLIEDAAALRALPGGQLAGLFVPWVKVPGVSIGTTRTLPMSAIMLGLIAAADKEKGHSNVAVAGPNGKASAYDKQPYAYDVTQTYTAQERADMNAAGVNVAIMDEGEVTNYGYRTLANPVTNRNWLPLSNARYIVGAAFRAGRVIKRSEFANLDAQNESRFKAESAIVTEVITPDWRDRAIFGLTPEEACSVSVEQDVDPDDGSMGSLTATLTMHPTKPAERIVLTVSSAPPTESL
ncbi:MAG TPA: hypothetical protein VFX35_01615 [Solirubrobacterales bacterium]|nr:hypothetical protein [Solirubrobacterales bacterium]